jgi:hypothetical chaperone protein
MGKILRKAIGLDFGTTNSTLAIARRDGTVQLAQFKGRATFRSVLYFDESDNAPAGKLRVVAGPDAITSYLNAKTTGRLIQSMKSYLASRLFNQTQIFSETYSLEELIGILLRYLRQSAESEFGDLGSTLVVGRPVHFSGTQDVADDEFAINRLRAAFRNAGFEHVHFLPEPVAAAYKYQRQLEHDELVLIADFGGGTSDFSLVNYRRERITREKRKTQSSEPAALASPATRLIANWSAIWSRPCWVWAPNTRVSSAKFYPSPTGFMSISNAGITCRF